MARPAFSRFAGSTVWQRALRRKRANLRENVRHYKGHNLNTKLTAAAAALFILSAHCIAQTQSARLVGTVHDTSGASIPNAKITVTQQDTKKTAETTANGTG